MVNGYLRGVIINSKDTAAGLAVDISSAGSVLKGTVSGTVQFFGNGKLNRYKFHSSTPAEFSVDSKKPGSSLKASFNKVNLEDIITRSSIDNLSIYITATRLNPNSWTGSFHINSPEGQKLKIKGIFEGELLVTDPDLTAGPSANGQSALATPGSTQAVSKKQRTGLIPIVVKINSKNSAQILSKNDLKKTFGCSIKHHLPMINSFSTKVSGSKLQSLLEDHSILAVWRDKKVKAVLDISTRVVKAPPVWDLGLKGQGIGIAVVDTGVYPHPDLTTPTNRIIGFKDFINQRTDPYDDSGHGTHVAGDAAGNGTRSNGRYRGPAPEANIIGIKVLDSTGSGWLSDVLAGIQYAIDNKNVFNIRVLNLSLGAAATQSYTTDPLCQAVESAWAAGIVVCAAAGNSGPWSGTINTPGIDPKVITVGADNTRRTVAIADDFIPSFSSRGPTIDGLTKPDVVAPGVNIRSLRAPGSVLDRLYPRLRVGRWYFILSGTSMSTPICSGVAALMIQKNPGITPDSVKNILKATARKIGTRPPNVQGSGLTDALSSVNNAKK